MSDQLNINSMKIVIKQIALFIIIFWGYTGWITGFTFQFKECEMFPNYNMLTEAFMQGRLSINERPPVDYASLNGKRYLYSGPFPALLRLPFRFIFGQSIPTAVMIALFSTGIVFIFMKIIDELTPLKSKKTFVWTKTVFFLLFVINGVSLFMVTIPSIHHEAICTAMFFLLIALYCLLRMKNNHYRPSMRLSIVMGLSLAICIASRFSYLFSAIFMGCVLLAGFIKNWHNQSPRDTLFALSVIIGICFVTITSLMFYNYLRFGDFFEFGIQYIHSLYSDYFKQYGFFRFDHLPYNIWSMFFRIPTVTINFPFIILPTYILKSQSFNLAPLFLINANELCVSVFLLLPMTIFCLAPIISHGLLSKSGLKTQYLILVAICLLQILPTALSVASVARYYYDFFPILLALAYIGVIGLKLNDSVSDSFLFTMGALSVVFSSSLPMNAISFYSQYIKYESPLFSIFF